MRPSVDELAIRGGAPVRRTLLPYARQTVEDADVAAVAAALRSDWLTTGPQVPAFEERFARAVGAREAVAVNSGTAALHAAMAALGVSPGDEVIVPAMTFAATANAVVFQGGTPVFVDVEEGTLAIDPDDVARKIGPNTRAVAGVDYAGQPADWDRVRAALGGRRIPLVDDACHAIGGSDRGRTVGTLADISTFSLHPAKHVTSGEGGVATTDDSDLARKMRIFRNHGLTTDHREREAKSSWEYDMETLGWNYRLTDFQCVLAGRQLERLDSSIARRREIAGLYDRAFRDSPVVRPLARRPEVEHAWHLYVIRLELERLSADRGEIFRALRAEGIGVNVHYRPVHLHSYYRRRFGTGPGLCPVAERAYERMLTLPLFPAMSDGDAADVITALQKVCEAYAR
jgi:perosamine synthetase